VGSARAFGPPKTEAEPEAGTLIAQIEAHRARVPELLRAEPGQQIGGLASSLGVPIDVAQTIVRPLVGDEVVTRGSRRGTRYYLRDDAPPEEADEGEGDEPEEEQQSLTG
jgi:hypothetical protein